MDILSVCLEPGRMSIAKLTLTERSPSIVDISGDYADASAAAADGAKRPVSARE